MSEHGWSHPMCDICFERKRPGVVPCRLLDAEPEVCCWCGAKTLSGIYYRADPKVVHPAEVKIG